MNSRGFITLYKSQDSIQIIQIINIVLLKQTMTMNREETLFKKKKRAIFLKVNVQNKNQQVLMFPSNLHPRTRTM